MGSIMTADLIEQDAESRAAHRSILFLGAAVGDDRANQGEAACFHDLLLDQVIAAVTRDKEEYNLLPIYYERLTSIEAVEYRHEVWRDLEDAALVEKFTRFSGEMRQVRHRLTWSTKTSFTLQRRGWFLDAAERYGAAVQGLCDELEGVTLQSRGLHEFRAFLVDYVQSSTFVTLTRETKSLREKLTQVRYCINVKGPRIQVLKYRGESDYSIEIEQTFERFQQGAVKSYLHEFSDWPDMNHVQSSIADRVARLFREVFGELEGFCERHAMFVDNSLVAYDREIQFYLTYLDFIRPLQAQGLSFCLPAVQRRSKEVFAIATFDLALASKLLRETSPLVCNEFHLVDPERIIVVSGPNQGGKTTFARTIGQVHYLAGLGCPVAGTQASLFLYDQLYTHFGKEEDPTYLSGKLEDDLLRIRDVLNEATADSILIMNEIFASTTVHDALVLGTRVIQKVVNLDMLCVMVTFVDELTDLGPSIVSMASTVNPENPTERTFKIVRRPANGLAYAMAIAEKYGLTYDMLKGRIGS
jgi:hypothetical protein